MRYTRDRVELHADRYRPANPAVNVRVYSFPRASEIAEHFKCSEAQAEKAGQFAYEMACQQFWEGVQDTCNHILGKGYKVYSEGRSSGWCVVHGMTEVTTWGAIELSRWRKFEKTIKSEVTYQTSKEQIFEAIEANRWYLDGSEAYNFIDKKNGETICIAELKAKARAEGFGAVVRT